MRRIDRLVEGGIQFHLGFAVGEDATLDALRQKHDAILIATGVYKAREINVPGNAAEGVIAALDYLIASNRKRSEEQKAELQSLMRKADAVFCLKKKQRKKDKRKRREKKYR